MYLNVGTTTKINLDSNKEYLQNTKPATPSHHQIHNLPPGLLYPWTAQPGFP